MMTREDFYLEQLVPLFKEMDKLADEKDQRYASIEADHERRLAKLYELKQELRTACAAKNQELDKSIYELRGNLSSEAEARRLDMRHEQQQNNLQMKQGLDSIDASIRKVNAQYRADKVRLCDELREKKYRLQHLIGSRNADYKRRHYEQIMERRHQWNPLKRWIFRRFFWVSEEKKGGEV